MIGEQRGHDRNQHQRQHDDEPGHREPVAPEGRARRDTSGRAGPGDGWPARDRAASHASRRARCRSSLLSRARIDQRVDDVGEHVEEDVDDADHHGAAEHRVEIGVEQRVLHVEAKPGPGEHRLGQHRALQQAAEGQRDDGDQLHPDIAERVNPHHAERRQSLGQRRQHVFLLELTEHEAARHARDIGEREIAQDGGGQHEMAERVPEHVALAGDQAVDGDQAGDRRHDVVVGDVEAPRTLDPAELGVEQQQPDQPEPEHRHRIAEQRAEADHLVLPAPAMGGGDHAERHAEHHADEQRQEGQLDGGGKDAGHVLEHRVRGDQRDAEIAMQHFLQIAPVLHRDRQVDADLDPHPVIGRARGLVAHDGEHRVDRDDAADEEGDAGQPEEGERHREQQLDDATNGPGEPPNPSVTSPVPPSRRPSRPTNHDFVTSGRSRGPR